MNFFIADEHYYHANILMWRDIKAKRNFPTLNDMHKTIIRNHNEVVTKEDTVYHLGDFSFSKHAPDMRSTLEKLNGTHVLILGNHDLHKPFDYVEVGFQSVHTSLMLDDYLLIHDPAVAGVLKHLKVIHGHTHGLGLRLAENTYCVSVEVTDYRPVSFCSIKGEM
jgi:calcineurin-like phosphoesterase family protein